MHHNKKNLKDLLSQTGLFNFLLNYLKEMRNESLSLMISHETAAFLEEAKVGLNELHKLNDEQLQNLKNLIKKTPGHMIYQ